MPEDLGRRYPVDPRIIRDIVRSPRMYAEQGGSTFLQEWGGPGAYMSLAKGPMEDRVVYYALQAGYVTPEEIAVDTGIRTDKIESSMRKLVRRGYVPAEVLESVGLKTS